MAKPSRGLVTPLELNANSHDPKTGRKARVPLSCGPCRSRKLKCNRQQPCQNCIVRKEPRACVFAISENTKQSAISTKHVEDMQSQIDRLERLVTSLVSHQNSDDGLRTPGNSVTTQGSTPDNSSRALLSVTTDNPNVEENAPAASRGMVKVNQDHSVYVGPAHWSDVLNELNVLRTSWDQVQEEQYELALTASLASTNIGGPSFLCGMVNTIGLPELLASLPPKHVADKLIRTFFDENDSLVPSLHILHKPTFMRQYDEHWHSPFDTKLMWLGLLFSILSLTVAAQSRPTEEPVEFEGAPRSLFDLYRLRTAQCLMMADITKCLPYTIETLMYNTLAEQVGKKDSSAGVWALNGAIIRVAIQMGYHRDPSHYPNITIFSGEMRRRVWCALVTADSVSSFLVGLPSIVHSLDHDTADPRNIHDWELFEGMEKLPESRPAIDVTQTSYSLAKARLLQPLGEVVDFVNSLQPNSYERVLQIDRKLSRAHDSMPAHLKLRNMEHISGYSPNRINRLVQIEFLFHQGVCVLHRRFLVRGRLDSRFARSRKQCITSALALLDHQRVLYDIGKKTGSIKALYWFQISGVSQAFILPAVILCLDLRHQMNANDFADQSNKFNEDTHSDEMLEAVKTAQRIWNEAKDISPETSRVHRVLFQLLDSIDAYQQNHTISSKNLDRPASIQEQNPSSQSDMSGLDERSNTTNNEMDVDWSAWDSFIEGSSFEDAYGTMQFNDSGDFNFGNDDYFHGN